MSPRQIEIWQTRIVDVPECMKFQDLVESLKMNKEIKGLEKFVIEHVLTTLSSPEKQKVK